jgi:hypothetical protein
MKTARSSETFPSLYHTALRHTSEHIGHHHYGELIIVQNDQKVSVHLMITTHVFLASLLGSI